MEDKKAPPIKEELDLKQDNKKFERKPGYADIKSEYLLLNYKPKLQVEYLNNETKRKISNENAECEEKESPEFDSSESEPPRKKAKIKGRNKQRPRNEKISSENKLCPSILKERTCQYGENCRFNHDKLDFLSKKPEDIDGSCYNFKTFGFCSYGITCRYGKSHLSDDLSNVVNEDVFNKRKDEKRFLNALSEDTRHKLWKKKYNFKIADEIVKKLGNNQNQIERKSETVSADKSESNTDENKPDLGNSESLLTSDDSRPSPKRMGCLLDEEKIKIRLEEKSTIDFTNKLYLAPLTTVGNLPFRRICKEYGADITCGEMALATNLLKAKQSEWSLVKRHPSEDVFGVQICGSYPDTMTRCAQLLKETCELDFVDINCGCPIDLIFKKGAGSALMGKMTKLEQICRSMITALDGIPLTVKMRTGVFDNKRIAHNLIPRLQKAGVSLVTLHGRSREQRYTRLADWNYIGQCALAGSPMPVFGNGDILSYEDANIQKEVSGISGVMIARGALIKPWIFTEIKEQRHWDISSTERFDMLKNFTNYGLEHWGSDGMGVENTRRFLLEWLSFLYRYIPVGLLERLPQKINEKPPYYSGRDDLETLMASANCADWIKLTEMLLGPVPDNFKFLPKHKANAYQ